MTTGRFTLSCGESEYPALAIPEASSNGVCVRVSRVVRRPRAGADHRLGAEAAAHTAGIAPVQGEAGLHAEAHAELASELVVGDDDAAFDDDLTHGDVYLADQPAHFLQSAAGILDEQDIGSRIDDGGAALGQELAFLVGQAAP